MEKLAIKPIIFHFEYLNSFIKKQKSAQIIIFKMESIHYFYFIFRLLIIFQFIFPILTIDLRQEDDEAVVAFMGGSDQFDQFCTEKLVTIKQSKENLAQISGIYLGALFYLRKEWGSDKTFGLELDDPTKLGQFHENLDILYEYFYNVYAAGGHSSTVVKPKFVTIDTLNHCLTTFMHYMIQMWKFELEMKSKLAKNNGKINLFHKKQLFDFISSLKLINKDELDYLPKQLVVKKDQQTDDANETTRTKFVGIIEKIYKKAEKKLLEEFPHNYGMEMAIQDEAFVGFLKGKDNLANVVKMYGQHGGACKVFNSDKFEERVVLLHLMKKHWNCANTKQKIFERECMEQSRAMDRLYEYFCNVHGRINGLVKPQFYHSISLGRGDNVKVIKQNVPLIVAIDILINEFLNPKPEIDTKNHDQRSAVEQISRMCLQEIGVKMAFDWKDEKKTSATDIKRLIQDHFERYLNDLLQKWIKKGLEKKTELDALEEQIKKDGGASVEVQQQYDELKADYKANRLFCSPFFSVILKNM